MGPFVFVFVSQRNGHTVKTCAAVCVPSPSTGGDSVCLSTFECFSKSQNVLYVNGKWCSSVGNGATALASAFAEVSANFENS